MKHVEAERHALDPPTIYVGTETEHGRRKQKQHKQAGKKSKKQARNLQEREKQAQELRKLEEQYRPPGPTPLKLDEALGLGRAAAGVVVDHPPQDPATVKDPKQKKEAERQSSLTKRPLTQINW